MRIPQEATAAAFGSVTVQSRRYAPLDSVLVTVTGRRAGESRCRLQVRDASNRAYLERELALVEGRAEATFQASGALGVHRAFLWFPGERRHSRFACFLVDCSTTVRTGDADFDGLAGSTRELLLLNRREHELGSSQAFHAMEAQTSRSAADGVRGRMVGYVSADTAELDGLWLRDSIYTFPAYVHWETRLTELLDRFIEAQEDDGSVPDGIRRDGSTWKMEAESDNEYILVTGIYDTWRATGDDAWMGKALPAAERAIAYATSDPERWDPGLGMAKRRHTCDTWDFGMRVGGGDLAVAATCDQTGYFRAFRALAEMLERVGRREEAAAWARRSEELRRRAVERLWGGRYFLHHLHLGPVGHEGFDEAGQLAMGNVWTITRGLASSDQARSIVAEYRRRHGETGDAFPWWSLQPGYPDELGYFDQPHLRQGGYANGGLMPFVGGELCRGAFLCGEERYAVELLRQYSRHLRSTGGAHVWYWPDGTAGFRTPNEVPHAGWGMAQWLEALVEGLAGIRASSPGMAEVDVSPRWAAAGVDRAAATLRVAATGGYVSYRMSLDRAARCATLAFTGSGARARFRLLLPEGWVPATLAVDAVEEEVRVERVGTSAYACFDAPLAGASEARLACRI
jgi:hypothetical protein